MKNRIPASIIFFILIISSCTRISFIYPVSEKKQTVVFRDELLGEWGDRDDSSFRIVIDSLVNYDTLPVYTIKIYGDFNTNFGDTSYLFGMLINCNDKLFMELSSNLDSGSAPLLGLYNAAMIIQTFYYERIFSINADSMVTGQLDGKQLIGLITNKKINIRHEFMPEGDLLILEKGEILQNKLAEMDRYPQVYEKITYCRIK